MKHHEIVNEIKNLYDENFLKSYERRFRTQLRPENCFCPGLNLQVPDLKYGIDSKENEYHNSMIRANNNFTIDQIINTYFCDLSLFIDYILKNEPVNAFSFLIKIKQYLSKCDISLSDFICGGGIFDGKDIYYVNTDNTCVFAVYTSDFWMQEEHSPVLFKKLKFECLTKGRHFHWILIDMFFQLVDDTTKELLKKMKWDDINFEEQDQYIRSSFYIKSELKDYQSERQQAIQIPQQTQLNNQPVSKESQYMRDDHWQEIQNAIDEWVKRPFKPVDFEATIRDINNSFDLESYKEIGNQNFEELKKILRKQSTEITPEDNKFLEESFDNWSAIIERAEELGQKSKFDGLLPIIIKKLEDIGRLQVNQGRVATHDTEKNDTLHARTTDTPLIEELVSRIKSSPIPSNEIFNSFVESSVERRQQLKQKAMSFLRYYPKEDRYIVEAMINNYSKHVFCLSTWVKIEDETFLTKDSNTSIFNLKQVLHDINNFKTFITDKVIKDSTSEDRLEDLNRDIESLKNFAERLIDKKEFKSKQPAITGIEKPEVVKYDNFDFINRIEVLPLDDENMLSFTVYYNDSSFRPDLIQYYNFHGCWKTKNGSKTATTRWGLLHRLFLKDRNQKITPAQRSDINESFKKHFEETKKIVCGRILGTDNEFAVKIVIGKRNDSYKRKTERDYNYTQQDRIENSEDYLDEFDS